MNKSKHAHEWWDYSWNPISGCSPVSEGCGNCYAAAISQRFGLPWGKPVFHPDRLDESAKVKKPSRIFVCSMSDIGHEDAKQAWRFKIFDAMNAAKWHTFILFTKRPDWRWMYEMPHGTWVGVTIENNKHHWRLETLNARREFPHIALDKGNT